MDRTTDKIAASRPEGPNRRAVLIGALGALAAGNAATAPPAANEMTSAMLTFADTCG